MLAVSARLRPFASFRLEMTRIMLVDDSGAFPHASMRACRFVPEPDIRTVMLVCFGDMVNSQSAANGCEIIVNW